MINPESPSGGFELLLSNDFEQRITTAFYKGSRSSGIDEILNHLRASARDIWHPVLLPLLILQSNIGPRQELHQREARALLQQVERDISAHMRPDVVNDGQERRLKPLPLTNADLIDCHSKVWKNPNASLEIVDQVRLQSIIKSIWDYSRLDIFGKFYNSKDLVDNDNREFESRIKFIRQRLSGLESYSHTTLSRIDMQRNALHNILLDRQNQTSLTIEKLTSRHNILLDRQNETALDIERRQQTEAHQKFVVNQSWSRSQLSLSLLGTIFLPGAFIAVGIPITLCNEEFADSDEHRQSSAPLSLTSKLAPATE